MNPTRSPDDPRDPHLLAALHNAPDRDAAPTALLSAAILAQARQAVRGAPAAAPRWRAWRAALDRLWQPAPMAAFGTLAMAAVIGVMWQGRELPDATPGLRPQRAATPPSTDGTISSEWATAGLPSAASAAESALPPTGAPDMAQASGGAPRQAGDAGPKGAAAPAPAARTRRDAPAHAPAPPRPAQGAETQPAQDAARSAVPTPWPAQAQAPPTAAAEVARAAPQAPPLSARAGAPDAPSEPAAAARAETAAERREAVGKALADSARPPSRAGARAQPGRLAAAAKPAPIDPLAPAAAALDAASGSETARVQWRMTPQRVLAHDGARRAWWTALQSATEGRWQRAAGGSAGAALTLLIDGVPGGSIAFEPQAVLWIDARGTAWRAPVGSVELQALQEPLARW